MTGQDDIHEVLEAVRNFERENGKTEEEIKKIEIIETGSLGICGCGGEGNYRGNADYSFLDDYISCFGYHFYGEYRNDPNEPLFDVIDPDRIQSILNETYIPIKRGKFPDHHLIGTTTTKKKINLMIICHMPNTGVEFTVKIKAPNKKNWEEIKVTKTSQSHFITIPIKVGSTTGKFKVLLQARLEYNGVTYVKDPFFCSFKRKIDPYSSKYYLN